IRSPVPHCGIGPPLVERKPGKSEASLGSGRPDTSHSLGRKPQGEQADGGASGLPIRESTDATPLPMPYGRALRGSQRSMPQKPLTAFLSPNGDARYQAGVAVSAA